MREDAQVTYDPRAWLSRDPIGAQVQALHDVRQANYEAGRGYFTDEEIVLKDADPASFFGGQGARLIREMATGNGNDSGEGAELVEQRQEQQPNDERDCDDQGEEESFAHPSGGRGV